MRITNMCFLLLVFLFYSDLKRIRTFVAKRRKMSKIRAFWYLFLLRFDSDKWALPQTLLRHLAKEMVSGASAAQLSHLPSFVSFFLMEEISPWSWGMQGGILATERCWTMGEPPLKAGCCQKLHWKTASDPGPKSPDILWTLVEATCGQVYMRFYRSAWWDLTQPSPSQSNPPQDHYRCHHLRLVGKAGNMSRARGTLRRTARTSEGARYLCSRVSIWTSW